MLVFKNEVIDIQKCMDTLHPLKSVINFLSFVSINNKDDGSDSINLIPYIQIFSNPIFCFMKYLL
jgi:hypothetical protein